VLNLTSGAIVSVLQALRVVALTAFGSFCQRAKTKFAAKSLCLSSACDLVKYPAMKKIYGMI